MVIEDGGQWRIVVSAFPRKRWAARVFRRSINVKSINRPCLSTARNRHFLVTTDLHIRLVHSPRGRTVPLVPADPLLKLRRVAMNPTHDRGRIHVYAPFLHHGLIRTLTVYLSYELPAPRRNALSQPQV